MHWLKISTTTELVRIAPEDIAFIAADGNYCDVYMVNGKPRKMTFQLHFFAEQLCKENDNTPPFVRVGKSIVVNKQYIHLINIPRQELILSGHRLAVDFQLKASKEALRHLKESLEQEGGKL